MKKKQIKTSPRRRYDTTFREQAIRLAQDLGSVQMAADKLGMTSYH
jgi:transposase-like protein